MSSDFPPASELELRLRRACAELDRRLRDGETEVAQQLLSAEPAIAADEDLAIELIYTEFVTLEELGAAPSPYGMLDRFPRWRDRLERLFQVHDAFRGDDKIDLKQSAYTLLEQLAAAFPHRITYQSCLGSAHTDVGRAHRRLAQYEDALLHHRAAISIHERLVTDDPSLEPLRHDLARSLYHMGRTLQEDRHSAEAVKFWQRSLALNPRSGRAANQLAWTLLMDPDHAKRDPSRALRLAQRAVELVPQWKTTNC